MFARTLVTAACVIGATAIGAGTVHADTPTFPDISGYTPVNVHDYEIPFSTPGQAATPMVYFLTPDGITCRFSRPAAAGCTGNNFPSVPPASPSSGGAARVNSIATDAPLQPTTDPIASATSPTFKTLPPFHSITVDGVICGVDDAGTTACKDPQGQAFVLSTHGSGWLPHA
jgi:hypothetical protein